ncbi:LytTR family DNA-binding domain-containing protein [Paludibacter sp. 221]|uniref:LytR/AlgR family response regulator transcription factor n=1 Tax=Paludibacter sp. 221 TaxID=2302939 RepID=UPI001944EFEB|nr:LytTR family DNA-binding domain-containing protein [Paludibacter sp. 221]
MTKIPAYLYEKGNIIRLILLTALFALLFINIFQPFGSRGWYPDISDFKYFFFSSLIILTGMLVVVISRWLMFCFSKKHDILYWHYFAWIVGEVFTMALFFSLFIKLFTDSGKGRGFIEIFQQSAVNTSLVLLLPYAILWLYFALREKNKLLQQLDVNSAEIPTPETKKNLLAFPDEKGELRISLIQSNLLYIESADNYVTIYYLNKSKLSHYLLRNSLKWIEENLTRDTSLVRCHRSYIINLDNVKVLQKTKDGIFLELDTEHTPDIPVSKTYYNQVMEKFSKYSV